MIKAVMKPVVCVCNKKEYGQYSAYNSRLISLINSTSEEFGQGPEKWQIRSHISFHTRRTFIKAIN